MTVVKSKTKNGWFSTLCHASCWNLPRQMDTAVPPSPATRRVSDLWVRGTKRVGGGMVLNDLRTACIALPPWCLWRSSNLIWRGVGERKGIADCGETWYDLSLVWVRSFSLRHRSLVCIVAVFKERWRRRGCVHDRGAVRFCAILVKRSVCGGASSHFIQLESAQPLPFSWWYRIQSSEPRAYR